VPPLNSAVMRMFRLIALFAIVAAGCAHRPSQEDRPLACGANTSTWKRLAQPPENKDALIALTNGDISPQLAEGRDVYWFASADGQRVRYCRGGRYGAETTEFSNKDGVWVWSELFSITSI